MGYLRQHSTNERLHHVTQRALDQLGETHHRKLFSIWKSKRRELQLAIMEAYRAAAPRGTWDLPTFKASGAKARLSVNTQSILEQFRALSHVAMKTAFNDLYRQSILRHAWQLDQVTPDSRVVRVPHDKNLHESAVSVVYLGQATAQDWGDRWQGWVDAYHSALNHNLSLGAMNEGSLSDALDEVDATKANTPASTLPNALDRIFESEAVNSISEGADAVAELNDDLVEEEVWKTRGDLRVCDDCDANEGLTAEEADGDIPLHPNAVLSGTTIFSYGKLQEMIGADYHGVAVLIKTAQGHELTIGPNHPIFTRRGMVKACELTEQDELIYDARVEGVGVVFSDANLKKMPMVEDVFQSGLSAGGLSRVSTARDNFHGDRTYCKGKVEVIKPAHGLLPIFDSMGIEKFRESGFMRADMKQVLATGDRPGRFDVKRVLLSTAGFVRGGLPQSHYRLLKVQSIHYITFKGRAFDASTQTGLYNSNGFVVSNCHCYWIIVPRAYADLLRSGTDEDQQLFEEMNARGMIPTSLTILDADGNVGAKITVTFNNWVSEFIRPITAP